MTQKFSGYVISENSETKLVIHVPLNVKDFGTYIIAKDFHYDLEMGCLGSIGIRMEPWLLLPWKPFLAIITPSILRAAAVRKVAPNYEGFNTIQHDNQGELSPWLTRQQRGKQDIIITSNKATMPCFFISTIS
ncbi:45863_t:CDS:2 [Gigaspora margarita]|uniref:45863_t:CDS:1 n=1 Tax=Gigaspora margarita TaxID=4874 RepID=A0ABN7UD87_GIGMA|nr:45863_t:CDS:2 [Gigaspora margarita]